MYFNYNASSLCIYLLGKKAEVQPAETHPLYLCQFVFYGCVFVNIFIFTVKNTYTFSYVLIKVQPHSDIFTPTYLYALTIVHPQFYVHWQIFTFYILLYFCLHYLFTWQFVSGEREREREIEKEREGQTGILHCMYIYMAVTYCIIIVVFLEMEKVNICRVSWPWMLIAYRQSGHMI